MGALTQFSLAAAALLIAGIAAALLGEAGTTFAAMILFAQCAYYIGRLKERADAQRAEG